MSELELDDVQRRRLNAISDVVNNRPLAVRAFDQVYMKVGDLYRQVGAISDVLENRHVVFVGDGDAVALAMYLHNLGLLTKAPSLAVVLDFDKRIVDSVKAFAEGHSIPTISAELYNVEDPLPPNHWQRFDSFYTNPPFGASNGGTSVKWFVCRGVEATGEGAIGLIVVADDRRRKWTQTVLGNTVAYLRERGFLMVDQENPVYHEYHLDDDPDLRSRTLIAHRVGFEPKGYLSDPMPESEKDDFYGRGKALRVKYFYGDDVPRTEFLEGDQHAGGVAIQVPIHEGWRPRARRMAEHSQQEA